jgi:O-antigen/teichoic acid export membrane protein
LSIATVKKNLAANFVGIAWTAVITVLLIPVYIKFLGIEAWGLIGIFTIFQTVGALLDFGLSHTLNRELAKLSVQENKAQEMRDLLRTLASIYWVFAAAFGIAIFLLAPFIANRWLEPGALSSKTIQDALRIVGLVLFFHCPAGLYSAGLLGIQRQVLLSGINVSIATLRGIGSVLILWKVSPTLQAFFYWQALMSLLLTCLAGWFLWRSLPHTEIGARFKGEFLRSTWRFAAGMSGFMAMSLILTHIDKIILSKLLSLASFGYYILASTIAASIYLFVLPVFFALYPKFTQLVSVGDEEGLKELYHHSCQFLSALIFSIAAVVAFFSRQIVLLWTGDPAIVEQTYLILGILVIGTALHGSMYLPYALQFAYGWTKLAFSVNVVAVVLFTPVIIQLAFWYGGSGAALGWVLLNGVILLAGTQLMHAAVLKGERWRWYSKDVGLPLVVSVTAAFLCSALAPKGGPRFQQLIVLACVTSFVLIATFLATPVTRLALIGYFRTLRSQAVKAT